MSRPEVAPIIDPLNRLSALSFLTAGSAGETAFDGFVPAASTTRAVDNAAATTTRSLSGRMWREARSREARISELSCTSRDRERIGPAKINE